MLNSQVVELSPSKVIKIWNLNLKPNRLDLSNVIQLPEEKRKEIGKCFYNKIGTEPIIISRCM